MCSRSTARPVAGLAGAESPHQRQAEEILVKKPVGLAVAAAIDVMVQAFDHGAAVTAIVPGSARSCTGRWTAYCPRLCASTIFVGLFGDLVVGPVDVEQRRNCRSKPAFFASLECSCVNEIASLEISTSVEPHRSVVVVCGAGAARDVEGELAADVAATVVRDHFGPGGERNRAPWPRSRPRPLGMQAIAPCPPRQ